MDPENRNSKANNWPAIIKYEIFKETYLHYVKIYYVKNKYAWYISPY